MDVTKEQREQRVYEVHVYFMSVLLLLSLYATYRYPYFRNASILTLLVVIGALIIMLRP